MDKLFFPPVFKFTAKIFGTGHLGHLLPSWAQASFSFHILLTQSIPSVIVRTHIQPNSKRTNLAFGVHFTSCFMHPLGGAPLKLPTFKEGGILDPPLPSFTKASSRFQSVRAHWEFYLIFPKSFHFIQTLTGAWMALLPIIGFPGIDSHSLGIQRQFLSPRTSPSLSLSFYIYIFFKLFLERLPPSILFFPIQT